jgi:hypothetical protein
MKRRLLPAVGLVVLAGAISGTAAAGPNAYQCMPLVGKAHFEPDPACKVIGAYPGFAYFGAPNTCFSATFKALGFGKGHGSTGFTSETLISPLGGSTKTAAMLNEAEVPAFPNEFSFQETRRFFTGRGVISFPGGKLYSAYAGVLNLRTLNKAEEVVITNGDGAYAGAKGEMLLSGNLTDPWVKFHGNICLPAGAAQK